MIATLGLSVVYFKLLSIGTYVPMVLINYKYPVLDKVIEHKFFTDCEKSFSIKYPKLSKGLYLIGHTINKSAEFMSKVTIRQIQNYKNIEVCPKKLSKAIIHTSISYKLLLPIYAYMSWSFAKKHIK
jgi:hypothetical protein